MEHPDKSLNARLFINAHAKRLMQQTPLLHVASAIARGLDAWQKSEEREEMIREWRERGFGLDEAARVKKENGGKNPLKANIFEMAAAKQARR